MAGLDGMREAFGDAPLPTDLALIVAICLAACFVVSTIALLGEVAGRPDTWPVVAGSFGFWPLALSGRPLVGLGILLGGLVGTSILTAQRERRRREKARTGS